VGAPASWGQRAPDPRHKEPYTATLDPESPLHVVRAAGAPWLRIHFGAYALGERSYITLTSLEDGGQQRLDSGTLPQWHDASAYFNGDAVQLELHVAPGEEGVFVSVQELTVGDAPDTSGAAQLRGESGLIGTETLCGGDDRVASTDSRVGRINGCTAWLVSNGAVLTAGHCADFDPDQGGPLLPDGVLDLAGVMEFNVPASQADGQTVMADPADQYPIDTNSVTWRFDGTGEGLGKDWAVFAVNPNSGGQRAHFAQGFFRMMDSQPGNGSTIRITGYGIDETPAGSTGARNAQNRTLQTDTGTYEGESSSGSDIWHDYRVDTEGANSGSPIIWESTGLALGIHTNGGCDSGGGGENTGTSFKVGALYNALRDFPGPNAIYVDANTPTSTPVGTVYHPYPTVSAGAAVVPPGGILSIVTGSYNESLTISTPMIIDTPVGAVRIGQ
jgi:V8-like Glu-specific endopeptidase